MIDRRRAAGEGPHPDTAALRAWLLGLKPNEREKALLALSPEERRAMRKDWAVWARPGQRPPPGDWRLWLICAGRGFGKTRAGAEWVRVVARRDPQARIALVAASLAEARAVMVEGESGLLACAEPDRRPVFEPSLRRLTWPNGAQAFLYSAAEPESLRGPQHSHTWCDEIGKWEIAAQRAMRAWDNLQMGLRLGEMPRTVATTTPRAVPLLRRLLADTGDGTVVSRGSTFDNAILPKRFLLAMNDQFGDTALGRQELHGELLEDCEGALWTRALLERCRESGPAAPARRVVVAIDPPASAQGDECGIVVAALGEDGIGRVLADASLAHASPERWARAAAHAAAEWQADRVVAEANQGGAMVESVLRAADCAMPVRLVHASRGKAARAEPVAALYETGKVRHCGLFPRLEDQLCGLLAAGGYHGPTRSPDRADALVWALSELMLGHRPEPRVIRI
jgi:phage terminase large subunit-like protein